MKDNVPGMGSPDLYNLTDLPSLVLSLDGLKAADYRRRRPNMGWRVMHRSESQFCRHEAERLLKLAKETTDRKVRKHLTEMAEAWVERAKVKEPRNQNSLGGTAFRGSPVRPAE